MKQRLSALDLQLLSVELKQCLEGHRLNNIYNIADSNKQFLLKFNKTDSKFSVVVDCGLKIHTTSFNRPIPPTPSSFITKLRKHLKGKRLTALRQVPNDRILVLQFADGLYYLVFEFFSAGNVILLDENKKILSLQRIVHEHENRVGETYDLFDDTIFENDIAPHYERSKFDADLVQSWLKDVVEKFKIESTIISHKKSVPGSQKKIKVMSIHKLLLTKKPHLSSDLIQKNLSSHGIDSSRSSLEFSEEVPKLVEILNETQEEFFDLLERKESVGYIVARKNPNYDPKENQENLEYVYETFHPFQPFLNESKLAESKVINIQGEYNKTLDEFFSTIESTKYSLQIQNQEMQAKKKIEDARMENDKRLNALLEFQTTNEQKGHLIIAHSQLVEEVKTAVSSLIAQQMDWNTIEKFILNEQKKGNKLAQSIVLPLNLEKNTINVRLQKASDNIFSDIESSDDSNSDTSSEEDNDSDDDTFNSKYSKRSSPNDKSIVVAIDITISSYANASRYFDMKKSSAEKQKKVEKNVEKAMKNIEQRVDAQLKKKLKESHDVLKKYRKPYFFEKYNWFLSSEGFLVMMGKSDLETDQLYSKYIEDDDVYVTNSFGTQVWIKNVEKTDIPPNTLMQAGILCMSASEAWSKKISSSAWWTSAKNITKFDFDKSVLPTGRFRLKNEESKNYLAPSQLVMGFGFIWKIKTLQNQQTEEIDESIEGIDTAENESEPKSDIVETVESNVEDKFEKQSPEVDDLITDLNESASKLDIEPYDVGSDDDAASDFMQTTATMVDNMNKNVRGKKGKLKKIQKKYADQDEEERYLRLQALGTLRGIEVKQQKEKEELIKQEQKELKKAKLQKQKERQILQFTNQEKIKVEYSHIFEELKLSLNSDDEIIDAIPIFAPWPSLQKCKYKIKIQPGTAKKTKSLTEILHHFLNRKIDLESKDKELDWPQEHEKIKTFKAPDLVSCICVDKLKVSSLGQDNSKNSNKSGKNNTKSKSGKKKK